MRRREVALSAALLAASSLVSCRFDPVPQEVIDDLGPEEGTPSETHRAGQPCLACHSAYAGAAPQMVFGGTVYTTDPDGNIVPAPGVLVTVYGAVGDLRTRCSNAAGNFYLEKEEWKEVTFPLQVEAGSRAMVSFIGRDGSCGTCHKPPDPDHLERDPVTGAARDSAGYVLVNPGDVDQCN
jgi:hypothetical protein